MQTQRHFGCENLIEKLEKNPIKSDQSIATYVSSRAKACLLEGPEETILYNVGNTCSHIEFFSKMSTAQNLDITFMIF